MKQLVVYFLLSVTFSWLIWLPLYAHLFGIQGLPVVPFNHALGALGPLLAAVTTTLLFSGRNALKLLSLKTVFAGSGVHFITALLSSFVLLAVAVLADHFTNNITLNWQSLLKVNEFPQFNILSFFFYNLVFFGFGEEVGWRGFALPRLQRNMNAFWASIILTVFWALWHLPLFFYRPGYTGMDIAGITGWFFSLLTGSILLTWLYNSSKGSILVCAVFHTTIDVAFTSNISGTDTVNYLGMLVTLWGIAVLLIFKPAQLSLDGKFTGQMQ